MLKTTARSSAISLALVSTLLVPALAQAAAARIDFAIGNVKAIAADGRSRPLAKGAEVAAGELVDTGSGRAQLRFSDGALMALAPQTQFRIDEYQFNGKADGSEKGFFSLIKGAMRTISGLVGKTHREHYKVTTTVATIGIRGTEYSVAYGNNQNITTTTGEGSTEVCNAAGCLILNSGETAFVPDLSTKPVMVDKKAEIPPPPPEPIATLITGNDTDKEGKPEYLPQSPTPQVTPSLPPLASGNGMLAGFYMMPMLGSGGGWLGGALTFDPSGKLTQFVDSTLSPNVSGGTVVDYGNDGYIAWGRWTGGTWDSYAMTNFAYVGNLVTNAPNPSITPITGTYNVYASTSPVAVAYSGAYTAGAPNSVTGSLTANFTGASGGTLTYSLSIPVAGETFMINGSAAQYGTVGFLGTSSSITSSGTGCASSCTGIVPSGDAIQGFFAGPNAERAGATYAFGSSTLGGPGGSNVSGAVVFKK